ncbi:MAG: hypothetical protein U5K70_09320 [Halodesulfurarchaeum sp.]|nr:hypothetical protein [Halodesulfurarchaeum sp.]
MKRAIGVLLLIVTLLVGGVVSPAIAGATFGSDTEQVGDLETDLVIIQATVSDAGSADFQIQYAIELADENESEAFDDLAADIEANESAYLSRFADRMNATVDAAETTTGRSMTVGDFAVATNRTTLGKEYGLVTYSATWTNFANASGDQLLIGDALEGLFIDQDTRFVVRWSETYRLESVTPSPTESTDGEIVWKGPREFDSGEPSVTLAPTVEETEPSPTTQAPPNAEGGIPWSLLGVGIVIVLLIAGFWYRRNGGFQGDSASTPGGGAGTQGEASGTGDSEPPAELLSNEERVEQYLESVGGRSKQQEIVEALDWTEAKTSQVLSEMKEAGTIEKFRIGRENVVKLADAEDDD